MSFVNYNPNEDIIMKEILQIILTSSICGALPAFITFLITRHDEKKKQKEVDLEKLETRLGEISDICLGLAHDRIIYVGKEYLQKGNITIAEREDFRKYLWGPYHAAGGNGSGDAIMNDIDGLEISK